MGNLVGLEPYCHLRLATEANSLGLQILTQVIRQACHKLHHGKGDMLMCFRLPAYDWFLICLHQTQGKINLKQLSLTFTIYLSKQMTNLPSSYQYLLSSCKLQCMENGVISIGKK